VLAIESAWRNRRIRSYRVSDRIIFEALYLLRNTKGRSIATIQLLTLLQEGRIVS
jgi:hypothetical protein